MQEGCKKASLIVGDLRPPVDTPEPYFQDYMSKLFKYIFTTIVASIIKVKGIFCNFKYLNLN
ncbi:MAG: hypothetical protein K0R71_2034 [Bacillales bacterium]|jgi:hypothetical protein|nr:hypothetical protein [Bacillales bacterium]